MRRLGVLLVFCCWFLGCASVQRTPSGPVVVLREPGSLCSRLASVIGHEQVAVTLGVPIACGEPSPCLVAHEQVHAREQAEYPGGAVAWIRDWLRWTRECVASGKPAEVCHRLHPMEQAGLAAQEACEAAP